jgi:prenyltransferase beta subunit
MRSLLSVIVCIVLVPFLVAQSADEKKASVAYIQKLQTTDGGFRADSKSEKASLRGTSSSLRAIKYFGGKVPETEACKKFVLSCFDRKTGGFANEPGGKPDVILTSVGLMALVELKVPTEKYEEKAIAFMADNARSLEDVRMAAAGLEVIGKTSEKNRVWVGRLSGLRNRDGTFGKEKGLARDTGSYVACLLRLGAKVKDGEGIVKKLDGEQRDDGAFGKEDADHSDLETTYRVMRTYHMLKGKPAKEKELRAFVAKCRNKDGGYGVAPGLPSTAGSTYFASIILHWLDAK